MAESRLTRVDGAGLRDRVAGADPAGRALLVAVLDASGGEPALGTAIRGVAVAAGLRVVARLAEATDALAVVEVAVHL
jgi:hypothetical protein